eukprot:m.21342 g.21342  ORF g.21342 m.21342 type:complete len:82 (-) comp11128_c0_seq1:24-269(-)
MLNLQHRMLTMKVMMTLSSLLNRHLPTLCRGARSSYAYTTGTALLKLVCGTMTTPKIKLKPGKRHAASPTLIDVFCVVELY